MQPFVPLDSGSNTLNASRLHVKFCHHPTIVEPGRAMTLNLRVDIHVGFLPMVYPKPIVSRYVPLGSCARSAARRSASNASELSPKTFFEQNEVEYRLPMI